MLNILRINESFKFFNLTESEENNYIYINDLDTIIRNYDNIIDYFSDYIYEESVNNFIDLLFLKKISSYDVINQDIEMEHKMKFDKLISLSKKICPKNFNTVVIDFINNNFKEIYSVNSNPLEEKVNDLIFKFQNGININVFFFLIEEKKFLLFNNYEKISRTLEKSEELLNKFFSSDNILEFFRIGMSEMINIYIHLNNKQKFETVSLRIINEIIKFGHLIVKDTEERELSHIYIEIEKMYKFLNVEKHFEANNFKLVLEKLKVQLNEQLMEDGHLFTQEIPVGKIVEKLMENFKYPFTLLNITHQYNTQKNEINSRLNFNSKGAEGFIDKISSTSSSDNFYTHSHKKKLDTIIVTLSGTLHHLFINSNEYFDVMFNYYYSVICEINKKIYNSDTDLTEDIEALNQMIYSLKINKDSEKIILETQSYGICIFLCSYIEKILRDFYFYLVKDYKYVAVNKITLNDLINEISNPELKKIFGEMHLKHLKYFLLSDSEKKIGFNYRNRLAHWKDISWEEIDVFLVFKLLYLFTDVVNTIYIYLYLGDLNPND